MFRLAYTISIFLYYTAIHIASFFGHSKAKKWVNGRKGLINQYIQRFENETPWSFIWVHVSSLGEFEQGRTLIERIKKEYPDQKILLTFYSPSGYEVRHNYSKADAVMYLPYDFYSTVRKVLAVVRPKAVFFIKYDFWYNMINILRKKGIPIFFISSVFEEQRYYFWWIGFWFKRHLKMVEYFYVQTQKSEITLKKNGINNAEFVGDTRLDRVMEIVAENKSFPEVERFINGRQVLVVGSSWEPDEEFVAEYAKENKDIVIIIAPHDVSAKRIQHISNLFNEPVVKYSEISKENYKARILIVDTIGLLAYLYRYAEIVHVGNGFGKGIHNILEPLAFGKPVLFGPKFKMFPEAVEMNRKGGAFVFRSKREYAEIINSLIKDKSRWFEVSYRCMEYIKSNQGATELIMDRVSEVFWTDRF